MAETIYQETQALEDMGTFEAHGHEAFYLSAEFWVGMAFVLVVIGLSKPLGKTLKNMLVKRRENIINQIDEAQKLRDDAQLLLAQYERQFKGAQDEADTILADAQALIKHTQDEMLGQLDAAFKVRRHEAEQHMKRTAEKAQQEVYTAVGQKAAVLVQDYTRKFFDQKKHSALIDDSIDHILHRLKK